MAQTARTGREPWIRIAASNGVNSPCCINAVKQARAPYRIEPRDITEDDRTLLLKLSKEQREKLVGELHEILLPSAQRTVALGYLLNQAAEALIDDAQQRAHTFAKIRDLLAGYGLAPYQFSFIKNFLPKEPDSSEILKSPGPDPPSLVTTSSTVKLLGTGVKDLGKALVHGVTQLHDTFKANGKDEARLKIEALKARNIELQQRLDAAEAARKQQPPVRSRKADEQQASKAASVEIVAAGAADAADTATTPNSADAKAKEEAPAIATPDIAAVATPVAAPTDATALLLAKISESIAAINQRQLATDDALKDLLAEKESRKRRAQKAAETRKAKKANAAKDDNGAEDSEESDD